MASPKETYEEHNAVNHRGGKPHNDPKDQCQCAVCKSYRGEISPAQAGLPGLTAAAGAAIPKL